MVQQVPLPEDSISPRSRAQWRRWLDTHHAVSKGIWVVAARKGAGTRALAEDVIAAEAMCFGWAPQRGRSLDDERRLVRVAPRKKAAAWTAAEKRLAKTLSSEGRMSAAGNACVKAAKRSGTWTRLDAVEALEIPEDLARALASHGSDASFARLAPSLRRIALEWIHAAKRPATRAARVQETARLAKMNIVMTQWRINARR